MPTDPGPRSPHDPYALFWNHCQDALIAVDRATGMLVHANPAAEVLTGYLRAELVGMAISRLLPEVERGRTQSGVHEPATRPWLSTIHHVQRKDHRSVAVEISWSEPFTVDDAAVVVGSFHDITDRVRTEHRLASQHWALSAYSGAALALGFAHTAEGLMQAVCESITRESAYLLAWVGLADAAPERPIRIAGSAGPAAGYIEGIALSWSAEHPNGVGPSGAAIRTGERQIIHDTESSVAFRAWRERARRWGVRSCAGFPFVADGGTRGVLMVYAAQPDAFEAAAIEVFHRLAEEVGHGLRARAHEQLLNAERVHRELAQTQLAQALTATVRAMAATMEKRDPYTAGHEDRVAQIAAAIGRELGFTDDRLQGLHMAALVHDIGKISVPIEILTRPTVLRTPERALIYEHPDTGHSILKDIPFPWPIADIVWQHHERLDGSGYPQGLKSDAILLEARVLSVADIVESMASYRPYRPALGLESALIEIERQSGRLLDPDVVRACLVLFREKDYKLPSGHRY